MTDDHFECRHFLDRRTGKAHRKYTYKRKPCNRLVIDSKIANQLAGYSLIEKDLRSCLAWLAEIERRNDELPSGPGERFGHGKNRENYTIIKGLFVAILTFYAKCFTRCEGRRVKLERNVIESQFHDAHDRCMSYRHNFAAHSGAERVEAVTVVVAYPNPKKGKVPSKVFRELHQPDYYWATDGEIGLKELVGHVHELVTKKIDHIAQKIQSEEVPALILQSLSK